MPDACIGVDVIVGFPGESDELFNETRDFITSLPVSYLHVFTYSERDNTTALRIDDVVPMEKRHERNKLLRIIGENKKSHFYHSFKNEMRPVLWEAENDEGMMSGFTDNYIKVRTPFDPTLVNKITKAEIQSFDGDGNAIFQPK
jgi:threonylcarbamoyladenosine tRNA methylthiotransferase MtaB